MEIKVKYFGSIVDCEHLFNKFGINKQTESIEVMLHPCYDRNAGLVDRTFGKKAFDAVHGKRG